MAYVIQNVLVVTAAVIGSLLIMAALNRIWPWEERRSHNDLIGWQVSILGTTYAVILGFMLYAVWTTFQEAGLNLDLEANAIVDVYRLAKGLPEPQRTQLRTLALSYAEAAVNQDWPQMGRSEVPERTPAINQEMWEVVIAAQVSSPTEINAQQLALSE